MQTYTFKVVVEPDEGGYHAYCPALRRFGAVTQGETEAEALKNINEVVQMIMDELKEDRIVLPTHEDVEIHEGTLVAVTVACHGVNGANTTFVPKTLRSMIEDQAGWEEDDLRRPRLLR